MTDAQPRIAILMPTYNAARHLPEQVDSLLAQTWQNFIIINRDDGSTDDSVSLMARYARADTGRIHIAHSDGRNLGASGSFSWLMQYALRERETLGLQRLYLMCSDQDDVWHPHKIALSMQRMQRVEQQSPGVPVLVHCDLEVVDEQKRQLAPSFMAYQGLSPYRARFARMLVGNTVSGCAMLANEELVERAAPVPGAAIMHDWWLALVASAFGRISFIDEPLLQYRQHDSNVVGAHAWRQGDDAQGLLQRLTDPANTPLYQRDARQAEAFAARYRHQLTTRQKLALQMMRALVQPRPLVQKLVAGVLRNLV